MLNENYKPDKYSSSSHGETVGEEITNKYRAASSSTGAELCVEASTRSFPQGKDFNEVERNYITIGVAGPVGSGKTALIERLSRLMCREYSIAVITNDIYTQEDATFLTMNSLLPANRIIGVETGGCPHTAIREDASMNLEAVQEMVNRIPGVQIIFIESGGDNLSATFSPDLADVTIFIIDVAGGDKIPRKGGPGIIRSDLLVINKIDLAPYVKADLVVMHNDAAKMRKGSPFVFTDLMLGKGLDSVIGWIKKFALLEETQEPQLCR